MDVLDLSQITLRPMELGDWPRIHEWASLEIACRYQPWGPNDQQQTEAFVTAAIAAWGSEQQLRYPWVAVHPATGVIGIGELNIRNARWRRGEISYSVHHDWWGKGVAGEIARLLCRIGFEVLDLERVEATCDPRNGASAAVLKKIGMTYEGTLRRTVLIREGWRDSAMHSLIRPDWKAPATGTPARWSLLSDHPASPDA